MRHSSLLVGIARPMMAALVGLTLTSLPRPAAARAQELSGAATITGVLYKQDCYWFEDPDDPPGARAGHLIRLVGDAEGRTWTTTTDSEGHFSFTDLPPGTYWAMAEGRRSQRIELRGGFHRIALCGTTTPSAPAASFDALGSRLRRGRRISVTLADGATLTGRMVSISPDELTIRVDGRQVDLAPDAVWRIESTTRLQWWQGLGAGAAMPWLIVIAAGSGEGAAAGMADFIGDHARAMKTLTGIGAGVGLLVAVFSRPSPTLVYQSDRGAGPRTLRLLPILTKDVQGAVVSVTWKGGR